MPNITLRIDEEIVRKVRKIAVERNTTLAAMVREYLGQVAQRDTVEKARAANALDGTFRELSRDMGRRRWTRDDLHDR